MFCTQNHKEEQTLKVCECVKRESWTNMKKEKEAEQQMQFSLIFLSGFKRLGSFSATLCVLVGFLPALPVKDVLWAAGRCGCSCVFT